jgi:hypothetical protein
MVVGLAMMFVAIVTTMQEVTPTDLSYLENVGLSQRLGSHRRAGVVGHQFSRRDHLTPPTARASVYRIRGDANTRAGGLRSRSHRVGQILRRPADLVHEPVNLRGGEETDVVLFENPLDAGSALRLLGAKLAHEDQLKVPELWVGVLRKEGFAFDGVAAGRDFGLFGGTGRGRLWHCGGVTVEPTPEAGADAVAIRVPDPVEVSDSGREVSPTVEGVRVVHGLQKQVPGRCLFAKTKSNQRDRPGGVAGAI